jgi:hypothetical protein
MLYVSFTLTNRNSMMSNVRNYLYDGIQTNKFVPIKHRAQTGLTNNQSL